MLLLCCIISFGALALEYSFNATERALLVIPLFVMFWIAGTFFQPLLKRNNSAFLFNLPVSAGERLIYAIAVLVILSVIIQLLGIAGAYTGYYVIHPLFNTNIGDVKWLVDDTTGIKTYWDWEGYAYYFAIISAFLFGSIYFKKNAFWLTTICIIGFFFTSLFYHLALFYITFGTISSFSFCIGGTNDYYISIALIPLFFLLIYLRLRETEV
jgi:hypothetical protein